MKLKVKKILFAFTVIVGVSTFVQCKNDTSKGEATTANETPVSGKTSILVEESIYPIVEDVVSLFEYEYDRVSIELIKKSENEILDLIYKDSLRLAVLPRILDSLEVSDFKGKVVPKMTYFANDAIVFISSKNNKDSIIDYELLVSELQSGSINKDKLLIFDNVNSSISKHFRELANVKDLSSSQVYYLSDTQQVIEYVNKNPNAIGVIGLNWLVQPSENIRVDLDNIKVLGVKNPKDNKYYKPSQKNIGEGNYPLSRKLYLLDFQGKSGLGMGFASYIAGYKGQRIVLKSGLAPFIVHPREVIVRKNIE
ncbi:PstS family phosphate ABC transporter substrate-binding protein [Myroides guanonis]|uniref:Phosphate ABC transporter substrate-binding protein, PhoT family n=1 Tax=Myroides guanonis TaxID=1150112 RepID=A0A1I3SVM7_9FLAO|nr:substrate-binding domain-containing protein [Myroides guanonis]SFJ61621.1 phosphate ABC transporter substrate-binding protein, PhoT family [Myroides guanonis]